jgi:hypothetical protein
MVAAADDARKLLNEHGLNPDPTEFIQVNPDHILFVTKTGKAMTAWLKVTPDSTNTGTAISVSAEPGFPCEPVNPVTAAWRPPKPFPLQRA